MLVYPMHDRCPPVIRIGSDGLIKYMEPDAWFWFWMYSGLYKLLEDIHGEDIKTYGTSVSGIVLRSQRA